VTFRSFFVVLLCCSMTFGQAASTMTPAQAPATAAPAAAPVATPAPAVTVAPDAAVITIKGVCNPPAADCTTVITKTDFDALVQAVQPQMPPKMQRQLAAGYVQLITTSNEARKRGLENTPRMQLRARLAVMQALQRELVDALQDEAGKISDEDVAKYYTDHQSNYDLADVEQLQIPVHPQPASKTDKKTPAPAAKTAAGAKTAVKAVVKPTVAKPAPITDEAGMKAFAVKLRARAAAGEDFAKLEAEALAAANIKIPTPETKQAKAPRSSMPPAVYDLKPGEISELITDDNAYHVYKMGAKTTKSLDEVKNDIRTAIKNERMQHAMEAISKMGTTTLNDDYFGPADAAGPQRGPGAPGRITMPHPSN
jgi:PPIC-type PPIASE domain